MFKVLLTDKMNHHMNQNVLATIKTMSGTTGIENG